MQTPTKQLFILSFLLLLVTCFALAQPTPKLVRTSHGTTQIYTDGKQLFSINRTGQISILDTTATIRYTFDPLANTPQVNLLLANPLKPVCYLPQYASAIILDKTLNPQLDLQLTTLNIHPQALVSITSSNILWAYDVADNTLIQYNLTQNKTIGIPTPLNIPNLQAPFQIHATPQNIYLVDTQFIHVFDFSGNYLHDIPIQTQTPVQFGNNQLWYTHNNQIYTYHLQQKTHKPILTLPAIPTSFALTASHIVVVCGNKAYWYVINT